MTSEIERTTISVGKETKERVRKLGVMGESYEDVIKRIVDEFEGKKRTTK